jgi:hypothetical protein
MAYFLIDQGAKSEKAHHDRDRDKTSACFVYDQARVECGLPVW